LEFGVYYVIMPWGKTFGWGVCGRYLTKELSRMANIRLLTKQWHRELAENDLEFRCFSELLADEQDLKRLEANNDRFPVLQGISDHRLEPFHRPVKAPWKVGYTFFEALLSEADVKHAASYFDVIAAGSSWCADRLREKGFPNVATVIQGIDALRFNPGYATKELFEDRFVVFSGGKFEFRKGQDIVIKAFKLFQDKHRDVLLVNSWFNHWAFNMKTMSSSQHIQYQYQAGDYLSHMNQTLQAHGIDARNVLTLPVYVNEAMPQIYQNTDIGLFPNRCEGGTNLVMMEYMACGKPVIASDSSGHKDIVHADNALIVGSKGTITIMKDNRPYAVWDEPDLDQTVHQLEWAYHHRDAIRKLGQNAGRQLAKLTWRQPAEQFHRLLAAKASSA
jgi:glycosyltransferase involved in cell wall biosynthesis